MLLRRIYIMALEHPGKGFFGALGTVGLDPSLEDLDIFTRGFQQCSLDAGLDIPDDCWPDFHEWLRSKDYFPCKGWASKIIEEEGDGEPAFSRFKELLFEYLESVHPGWFVQFNLSEQFSPWWKLEVDGDDYENATSIPSSADIRIDKHIKLAYKHA